MKSPRPPLNISLSNRQRHLPIHKAKWLRFLREAVAAIAADTVAAVPNRRIVARHSVAGHQIPPRSGGLRIQDLSVALVDDATIAVINQQFLNHTGPTDVISFDLGDGLGEIVVSAERAVIVARQLRRRPHDELALYLVHGLLHLAGLDDLTPAQRRIMRSAERRILQQSKIQR